MLDKNNQLWAYGYDEGYTAFGIKTDGNLVEKPQVVLSDVVGIVTEGMHSFAVKTDGSLWGVGGDVSHYMMGRGWQSSFIKLTNGVKQPYSFAFPSVKIDAPSPWAEPEVNAAIKAKLVPEQLQQNYTGSVSRCEVAQMFINLIEQASGKSIEQILEDNTEVLVANYFTDTDDPAVYAASALGIINGIGDHKFDPNGTLSRSQIAAIINRVAKVMGLETDGYTHTFTDVSGHWVDNELGWPLNTGIINGIGNNKFNPDGQLTTEQAIAITYRALKVLQQS